MSTLPIVAAVPLSCASWEIVLVLVLGMLDNRTHPSKDRALLRRRRISDDEGRNRMSSSSSSHMEPVPWDVIYVSPILVSRFEAKSSRGFRSAQSDREACFRTQFPPDYRTPFCSLLVIRSSLAEKQRREAWIPWKDGSRRGQVYGSGMSPNRHWLDRSLHSHNPTLNRGSVLSKHRTCITKPHVCATTSRKSQADR